MAQKYHSKPLNKQKARGPWEPDVSTALWTHLPSTALALSFHQRHGGVYATSPFESPFDCGPIVLAARALLPLPRKLLCCCGDGQLCQKNGCPSQSGGILPPQQQVNLLTAQRP